MQYEGVYREAPFPDSEYKTPRSWYSLHCEKGVFDFEVYWVSTVQYETTQSGVRGSSMQHEGGEQYTRGVSAVHAGTT